RVTPTLSTPTPTPVTQPSPKPSVTLNAGIIKFALDRTTIQQGDKALLSFQARYVTSMKITPEDDPDVQAWNFRFQKGPFTDLTGSAVVQPRTTTTYTITAYAVESESQVRPESKQVTLAVVSSSPSPSPQTCRPLSLELSTLRDIDVAVSLQRGCIS